MNKEVAEELIKELKELMDLKDTSNLNIDDNIKLFNGIENLREIIWELMEMKNE